MTAPRFATVLLDCDGTLLNTIDDLAAAGNHVCAAHGWPTHGVDAFKRMVGNGQRVLVSRFVPAEVAGNEAALEAAYQEFEAYYSAHKEDATAPYPGVVEALRELAAAGVRMGVLTNKNQDSADVLVEKYFGGLVDAVQGRVDGVPAKPAPEMTRALMGRLGADADATLMVGDTGVDVACGTNVGVPACGVLWGFRERGELEQAGARWFAATPAELVELVLHG